MERIPQSATIRVALKAYLSTDHVSMATGKTIAVVISKNAAAFGNPSAGATNATEIANGWYYVDLSTTDTGTAGPLIVRGTATGVDDVEIGYDVVNAHNAGFDALPAVAAEATGGLPTVGTASGRIALASGAVTVGTNNDKTGYSLLAGQLFIKKNTSQVFPFVMVASSDHVTPKTGLTVTATRSIDGAAFAACANSVSELANGWYTITLAAADTNGSAIGLRFTATGADDRNVGVFTQA